MGSNWLRRQIYKAQRTLSPKFGLLNASFARNNTVPTVLIPTSVDAPFVIREDLLKNSSSKRELSLSRLSIVLYSSFTCDNFDIETLSIIQVSNNDQPQRQLPINMELKVGRYGINQ